VPSACNGMPHPQIQLRNLTSRKGGPPAALSRLWLRYSRPRQCLGRREFLALAKFLHYFLRCHGFSPSFGSLQWAVAILICKKRSNVHGVGKRTPSPFDSEQRQGWSDLRVMLERWENHQPLNISTKSCKRSRAGGRPFPQHNSSAFRTLTYNKGGL
jgi:hypothetical protein